MAARKVILQFFGRCLVASSWKLPWYLLTLYRLYFKKDQTRANWIMLTQHLHPLHLTWKPPTCFTIGYGIWLFWGFHVQLWGCVGWERSMFHTDSLHTLLSAQWKAAGPWDSSTSPSDGGKSMDLNIFWDLAIQNATVDEMRCVCVGWWNSLRWFKFRLAGILGSSTVPSKYFLVQYDHA